MTLQTTSLIGATHPHGVQDLQQSMALHQPHPHLRHREALPFPDIGGQKCPNMLTLQVPQNQKTATATKTPAAAPRPGDCLVVAWWLPGGCLVVDWWLPGGCLVVAWWLPGGCLVVAWWLPGLPGGCLVVAWCLPGGCLVVAWWLLGGCMVSAWWLLAVNSWLPGGCLVSCFLCLVFLMPVNHQATSNQQQIHR